jgi:butyrate kinase
MHSILVINPGSTSTKVALYRDDRPNWTELIDYPADRLAPFHSVMDQFELRWNDLDALLRRRGLDPASLSAVSSRGGPFKPMGGGTYRVTPALLDEIRANRVQFEHASLLGVCLGDRVAGDSGIPVYFVDPVSVDEMDPVARLTGMPELERKSLVHALNVRAAARMTAERLGKELSQLRLVVAHLGGGISICALRHGRIVDVNNAAESGPLSPDRCGSLPVSSFASLCYSGRYTRAEMKQKLVGKGGLSAHLGTNDAREIEARIAAGDDRAELVYRAMAYQIAKEIGAMAAVLECLLDGIVLTGGLARSTLLVGWITSRISALGSVFVFPGEFEMEALALGALRVLRGEEAAGSADNP